MDEDMDIMMENDEEMMGCTELTCSIENFGEDQFYSEYLQRGDNNEQNNEPHRSFIETNALNNTVRSNNKKIIEPDSQLADKSQVDGAIDSNKDKNASTCVAPGRINITQVDVIKLLKTEAKQVIYMKAKHEIEESGFNIRKNKIAETGQLLQENINTISVQLDEFSVGEHEISLKRTEILKEIDNILFVIRTIKELVDEFENVFAVIQTEYAKQKEQFYKLREKEKEANADLQKLNQLKNQLEKVTSEENKMRVYYENQAELYNSLLMVKKNLVSSKEDKLQTLKQQTIEADLNINVLQEKWKNLKEENKSNLELLQSKKNKLEVARNSLEDHKKQSELRRNNQLAQINKKKQTLEKLKLERKEEEKILSEMVAPADESNLLDLQKKRDELASKLEEINAKIHLKQEDFVDLEMNFKQHSELFFENSNSLNAEINKISEENNVLMKKKSEAEKDQSSLIHLHWQTITLLSEEAKRADTEKAKLSSMLISKQHELEKLKSILEEKKQQNKQISGEHHNEMYILKSQIDSQTQKLDELQKNNTETIRDLEEKVARLQTDLTENNTAVSKLEEEIKGLNGEIDALSAKEVKIQLLIDDKHKKYKSLVQTGHELQEICEQLRSNCARLKRGRSSQKRPTSSSNTKIIFETPSSILKPPGKPTTPTKTVKFTNTDSFKSASDSSVEAFETLLRKRKS